MSSLLKEIAGQSFRGGFTLFLGDSISTILLAVGSILVARFLSPEGYGLYSLVIVAPSILSSLIALGMDSAVINFIAKYNSKGKFKQSTSFIKVALTTRLILSFIMWLICFLSSDIVAKYFLNRPEAGFYIKLSSFLIISQGIFNILYNICVGLDKYEIGAAVKIFMSIVKSSLAPILIIIGLGVAGAVSGHVLSFASASILATSLIFLGPYKRLKSAQASVGEFENSFTGILETMISYGLPLYVSSLLLLLADQYRLIVLAYNVSNFEIGNFQAAGNFLTLLAVISTPIATALFPAFSKLSRESGEVEKAFQYSVKYTGMLIVPAAFLTMIMSRNFIEIVYGHRYSLAPTFLSLYSILYICSAFGSIVLDNFFNGLGETRINLKATIVYIISFIPLSMFLTYSYGVVGLIISVLTSSILKILYSLYIVERRLKISIDYRGSLGILAASAAAAILTLPLALNESMPAYANLLLGGILYLAVYITILPIVKVFQQTDIEVMRSIFQEYVILKQLANLIIEYESRLIGRVCYCKKTEEERG